MQYSVFLIVIVGRVAAAHDGVVRPAWVESALADMEDAPQIARHKVRQLFREMREDGLLHFDGNQYIWNETHALNYVGTDVISSMKGIA